MSLTYIEVIDTAIKIGLGSIITAISGYFVLKNTQDNEAIKEQRNRFYKIQEQKTEIYVSFLAQSHALVQAHLLTTCNCNTEEYIAYLKTYSQLQISSSNKVRVSAYEVFKSVNEFIIVNKAGIERELEKAIRKSVNDSTGNFQAVAQEEITKEFNA
nr:hypothetical protein [uncultured Undibacterium sp.]